MVLDSGLTWSVIYDFCFGYRVEGSGGNHGVSDAFTKADYMNPNVPEEGIAGPFPNDNDCIRVYSCEEEFHGRTVSE